MKKLYLTMIAVMLLGFTYAQQFSTKQDARNGYTSTKSVVKKTTNYVQTKDINATYFSEDWEGGSLGSWTTIDNDGDGYNWDVYQMTAHGGTNEASSASWDATAGKLYPDNWLISPRIDLTSATGTTFLEWFIAAQDQTWPSEVYRVLISTSGTTTTDFIEVYPDETVQKDGPDGNNYWKRAVDISTFNGEDTVYIAFQHYNCTDMFFINLDDISVYENTIIDGGLTAITAPNNDAGCTLTSTEDVTVTVFNYGGGAITDFNVSYSVDGGTPVVETVSGVNIAPSTSYDYTFTQTADLSTLDYYTINASFTLTDDADGTNNNISTSVTNGDATITVEVETDSQGGQSWEIVNANGDVIASHGAYQWDIVEATDVCVMDNDCYTFNWFGGTDNTITITYNGNQIDQSAVSGDYTVYAIGGNCSAIDAKLFSLDFPGFTMPGTDVDITGTVKNVGTDPITSFDVDYTINGGTSVGTYSVTGVNITTGNNYNFTHDVVFNETVEAVYTIVVTISNVNGGTDGNIADNELTAGINVNSSQLQRVVLIEQFTTEQCPNCPPVLAYMEGIYENDPTLIMLTHHAGYYTDFLTIDVHEEMLDFYNDGGSTYAPAGMFDRHYNGLDNDGDGTVDPGPVFWDTEPYGGNRIADRQSIPAYVSVHICGIYDQSTRILTAKVKGEFYDNFTDIGTSLWVSEDHIAQQSQAAAPADFEHRFTSRAVISDRLGDPITTATTAGSLYSKYYDYTMDVDWDFNNLYLVGFVNTINANNVNDREVANAVQIKLSDLGACTDGVNEIGASLINIFPNPSTGIINVKGAENSTIEILNSLGQVIKTVNNTSNIEAINLSEFNSGNYIVRVITNKNIIIKKISLVK